MLHSPAPMNDEVITYALTPVGPQRMSAHASMRAAADVLPGGAYTTFRTHGGTRVLRLAQHLARLEQSLQLMGTPGAFDHTAARACVRVALRACGLAEARLRLTAAAEVGGRAAFYVTVEPFTPYPAQLYEEGVACVSVPLRRDNPLAKTTAFNTIAAAAYRGLPAEAHEGLMLAPDGSLLEGLSSNFFAVLNGALRSEEARVLAGTTRALVLEVARGVIDYVGQPVLQADLPRLSECFITSVSRGIMPVVRVDGEPIASGRPGSITRRLIQRMDALVAREAEDV